MSLNMEGNNNLLSNTYNFVLQFVLAFNIIMYKEPSLDGVYYPEWALSLGWMIVMTPIMLIFVWFLYLFCIKGGHEVRFSLSVHH